jgi:hypothetical protein
MDYNHFEYGLTLATHLKHIRHTEQKPRYFTAFGIEDLYNFTDKISRIVGYILIAVDGSEADSKDNGADALTDTRVYSFIVAGSTMSGNPSSQTDKVTITTRIAKQIRNRLLQDPNLSYSINRNTQINGIGPIGDNFYGVMLTFSLDVPEPFEIDQSFWEE